MTELPLLSDKFANFKKTDRKVSSILIQRCTMYFVTYKFTCLSLASFRVLFFHINHIHKAYFPTVMVVNIGFMFNLCILSLITEGDVIISSKADNYFH